MYAFLGGDVLSWPSLHVPILLRAGHTRLGMQQRRLQHWFGLWPMVARKSPPRLLQGLRIGVSGHWRCAMHTPSPTILCTGLKRID